MIIDVYQDTVCPWCRIGQHHLRAAIQDWRGEPVVIRWHPFELRPDMPPEGGDFLDHMAAIKGDRDVQPLFDRVCAAGKDCDLTFRFDRIRIMPNTLLSHALMAAAPEARREELLLAIQEAFFEQGNDIGNRDVLLEIGEHRGLSRTHLARRLEDMGFRARVAEAAHAARARGISAVPHFIMNNAIAVSGAQPPVRLLEAMEQSARASALGI